MGAKTRKAVVEDKLVSGKISSHTTGFVDPKQRDVAVCLIPGTELAFPRGISSTKESLLKVFTDLFGRTPTTARFVQVDKDNAHKHHDALEFADGTQLLLTDLALGVEARVLQLPAVPQTQAEAVEQERAVFV